MIDGKFGLPPIDRFCLEPRQQLGGREQDTLPAVLDIITRNTNSEETLKVAHQWLEHCRRHHSTCNRARKDSWRPTRLLKIDFPSGGQVTIDVASGDLCSHLSETEPYLTLSHCWGLSQPFKLTSETLPTLLSGLSISELPQTFQDAIVVTRTLGLKLLWIDSVCIEQDSIEDWTRESSLMGRIYSHSLCNIGATASSSSDQGLFSERNPSFLGSTAIRPSWHGHPNFPSILFDQELFNDHVSNSPLLRRGWVVQEHILCNRFLQFGSRQIFWECDQLRASEKHPWGMRSSMKLPKDGIKIRQPSAIIKTGLSVGKNGPLSPAEREEVYRYWAKIIRYYSCCNLSQERDKLVAISGIARSIQSTLGDTSYFAGLWSDRLPQDLLWFPDSTLRAHRELSSSRSNPHFPVKYRAPSWSWASVDGPITLHNIDESVSHKAEVVEVRTNSLFGDAFGEIETGFVRLRGKLTTVVLRDLYHGGEEVPMLLILGRKILASFCLDALPELLLPAPDNGGIIEAQLHFLLICADYEYELLQGLLLQHTGEYKGQFRRVGRIQNFEIKNPRAFEEATNGDWFEYEGFDGVDRYTVRIV